MARKPPKNAKMEARVAARMQKDLDGFTDKYNDILKKREGQYAAEVLPTWKKIGANLSRAVTDLYNTYADEDGKLDETRLRELERLQFLQKHVREMVTGLQGQDSKLTRNLAYTYSESYYLNAFNLEQASQIRVIVPALTHGHVMGVLANPWLPDGRTYSDRLRASTAFLGVKMREVIETAVSQGFGANETARKIQDLAGEGYFNAVRLARTELNRASSQGASHVFMQNADILDGKRWRATLDARTAPKDADNDGKIYALDYDTPENPGEPGQRIPNHPNCRCKYSPVLSALGPRTGERIARGDGDTTTNFGERTYTKAANYREYAKERGLPDLDERLRNDDPRKYLRQDEKGGPPAPGPAPIIAAAAATGAALIQQRIARGVNTAEDALEVGRMVREDAAKDIAEKQGTLQAELDELEAANERLTAEYWEHGAKRDALDPSAPGYGDAYREAAEEQNRIYREVQALKTRKQELEDTLTNTRRSETLKRLQQIRPMGNVTLPWAKGSSHEMKDVIQEMAEYLPTAWLAKAGATPMLAKKVKRGYYRKATSYAEAEIAISSPTALGKRQTAIHELGHRVEDTVPGIVELERLFYERRTAGDQLQKLKDLYPGHKYEAWEVTKKDQFSHAYAGKWYGGNFFELMSMGLESVYYGKYAFDDEFQDFVLGVLAAK